MKEACGDAHMKAILAIGELGTMENVYKVTIYDQLLRSALVALFNYVFKNELHQNLNKKGGKHYRNIRNIQQQ